MKNLIRNLWNDEAGIVVSTELVFVASIAGIGMIVGLSAARDGVTSELADVGDAVTEYNQSYQVAAITGHGASLAGSTYTDNLDFCDTGADDASATNDEGCIARSFGNFNENTPAVTPTGP